MRLLLTRDARDRVADRVSSIIPDAEMMTLDAGGVSAGSSLVDPDAIRPDVFWISHDAWGAGLIDTLLDLATRSRPAWLQSHMAGLDDPIWNRLIANGTRVTKSIGAAVPMAEYVLAHVLTHFVAVGDQRVEQESRRWTLTQSREVAGSHWTVVGWGAVGQAVATRALAFGAHVNGVQREAAGDALIGRTHAMTDLPALLPESDVVVLALPATSATRHLCDEGFFAALKPEAVLVNVARGGLVKLDALRSSLDAGKLGLAVLDTVEPEPPSPDSWLWAHPKVRLSAHTSWFGDGNSERMDDHFLENLRRFEQGHPLLNEAFA